MRDPFPTQGRLLGRLENDLAVREQRRARARQQLQDESDVTEKTRDSRNAVGQERVLRAIPITAPGVAGAVPGTRPDLIDWDNIRRRVA